MASAGANGVCNVANTTKTTTVAHEIDAATADFAGTLTRQRRNARAAMCTQSKPAALGGDRRPPTTPRG